MRDDQRTADQIYRDMCTYGPCPVCCTARTVVTEDLLEGGKMLSMVCPAGCVLLVDGVPR